MAADDYPNEWAARLVEESTREQGVPRYLSDPHILRALARIIEPAHRAVSSINSKAG